MPEYLTEYRWPDGRVTGGRVSAASFEEAEAIVRSVEPGAAVIGELLESIELPDSVCEELMAMAVADRARA